MRDAQASLRMPADLKREIQRIAGTTSRTLSNSIELLLRLGVEQYKRSGVLLDSRDAAAIDREARNRRSAPGKEDDLRITLLELLDDLPRERQEDVLGMARAFHERHALTPPAEVKSISKRRRSAA